MREHVVNLTKQEVAEVLKYLRIAKDQTEELFAAMIDIEVYGEVDHDGMPVVNSKELQQDLLRMKDYIQRMEAYLSETE